MSEPTQPRRRTRKRFITKQVSEKVQRPKWEIVYAVALILAICFLGGGRSLFVKGIAAASLGILVLVSPAQYRLPRALQVVLLIAVFAPLMAYLPGAWLGDISWRTNLIENWGIDLPTFGTAQPWVTAEVWIDYAIGIVWLAWCSARGSTTEDRRVAIRLLAAGLGLIATLTLLVNAKFIQIPWWVYPAEFGATIGPFANRNHTSSLMAISCVLTAAAAYDSFRRKDRTGFLFLALLIPCGGVIITNTSRAGIVLVFIGMSLWLATASLRKGFVRKAALIGTFALVGISGLFLFGGDILSRFVVTEDTRSALSSISTRGSLYMDAISITASAPFTGIGLGNFRDVFPQLGTTHGPIYFFRHPESDWLWLLTEGGIITFISFAVLISLLAQMTGPWLAAQKADAESRQDRRLRNAFAIAVFLAALHGFVDVPNHTPGYGLLSALSLGLALRASDIQLPSSPSMRGGHRLVGIGVLAVGATQLCIAFGNPLVPGMASARLLADRAVDFTTTGRDADAFKAINEAISMNPLCWTHYFQRAQLHLRLNHPYSDAHMDFGRARALEPYLAKFCFIEGQIWKDLNPEYAIAAWGEVLRRHPSDAISWYQAMLSESGGAPTLSNGLSQLAQTPDQKLRFLSYYQLYNGNSPDSFKSRLASFLAESKNVDSLDSKGRHLLFQIWSQRGDRAELIRSLETNTIWQQDGWQILSQEYARDGKYEEAFKLARRYESPAASPSISAMAQLNQLEQNFLFNPTDPRRGIDLYFAYKTKGDWTQALATLEKISTLPTAPYYLTYEMASIYAEKGDFRRAWELMFQYLNRPK